MSIFISLLNFFHSFDAHTHAIHRADIRILSNQVQCDIKYYADGGITIRTDYSPLYNKNNKMTARIQKLKLKDAEREKKTQKIQCTLNYRIDNADCVPLTTISIGHCVPNIFTVNYRRQFKFSLSNSIRHAENDDEPCNIKMLLTFFFVASCKNMQKYS